MPSSPLHDSDAAVPAQRSNPFATERRQSIRSMVTASLIVLAAWPASAAPGSYRGFTLGTSTAEVMTLAAGTSPRDLKRIHDRPAVAEELAWRPPYRSDATGRDSVSRIVFSFVDNQLFRMTVTYDPSRTQGLTSQDLIASLSSVYGPVSTPGAAPSKRSLENADAQAILASWRQDDTTIVLTQAAYADGFGLTITSPRLEALARKAQADSVVLETREAPMREAARVKSEADAKRAAEEKTRTTNKAAFKP